MLGGRVSDRHTAPDAVATPDIVAVTPAPGERVASGASPHRASGASPRAATAKRAFLTYLDPLIPQLTHFPADNPARPE